MEATTKCTPFSPSAAASATLSTETVLGVAAAALATTGKLANNVLTPTLVVVTTKERLGNFQ